MSAILQRNFNRLLLIISVLCVLQDLLISAEIQVLNEFENAVHLKIESFEIPDFSDQSLYPQKELIISLPDAYGRAVTNTLSIPYWSYTIALPTLQTPEIHIEDTKYTSIELPCALAAEDLQALQRLQLAKITQLGYLRQSPVATLEIHPLRTTENPKIVKLIQSIQLNITFPISNNETYLPDLSGIQKDIDLFNALLNPKFAKQWARARQPSTAKPVEYPAGTWYRISLNQDGIYTVSYQDLQNAGLMQSPIQTNRIFLFSNSSAGRELDDRLDAPVSDNLTENARLILNSPNGLFQSGSKVLFWGRAPAGMDVASNGQVQFFQNAYASQNHYWLFIADQSGEPKIIMENPVLASSADTTISTFTKIDHHEIEATNFLHSGKYWYGEKFPTSGSSVSVVFQLPYQRSEYPAEVTLSTRGATNEVNHVFRLFLNNSANSLLSWSTNSYYSASKYLNISLSPGINIFKIEYSASVVSAQAYLDFIECRYEHDLSDISTPLEFWGKIHPGIQEYRLNNVTLSNFLLFDITDFKNVALQAIVRESGNDYFFRTSQKNSALPRYYLTNEQNYKSPNEILRIPEIQWTSLRNSSNAADYIIITSNEFKEAAEDIAKLYSQDLREADRLSTMVVLQNQIIREFNGDVTDPHAIRFFLKYAFENWAVAPAYVLLFGDGTYDYRGLESTEGNYVLSFQVEPESQIGSGGFSSYVTDARFTYLAGNDQYMDIAIGRIPCRTLEEAANSAEKIRLYLTEPEYGTWRNHITLVADDPVRPWPYEEYHIKDTENYLATSINNFMTLSKLYLLEFPEVQDASTYGVKKPAATAAILKQLEDGTTIINYLGHGSPTVWAQEYILQMERDLGKINTGMKLPFWIAATCSWGEFDGITGSCMPEALLLQSRNGAIAALAASRPTYPNSNRAYVSTFLRKWFTNKNINRIRVGRIFQQNLTGNYDNNEKYILFGDPALYIALPYTKVVFDPLKSDTIVALKKIPVSGNSVMEAPEQSGPGVLTVFDSERIVTREYLDGNRYQRSMTYRLPGEVLFKGNIQFQSGHFASRFIVPKDLNYEGNYGLINLIAWNPSTTIEVGGFYDSLTFSGTSAILDSSGPIIEIGFEGIDFHDGDYVSPSNLIRIALQDPLGINISGQLGHNIILQYDNDQTQSVIATDQFTYDTNSDTSGFLINHLPALEIGEHSVSVTAWDNANNQSNTTATFILTESDQLQLKEVVNFPNPFENETDLTFFITHAAEVKISIYTVRGLLIKEIVSESVLNPGFNAVHWDGKDDFGDQIGRGIYLYQIQVKSADNHQKKDNFIGKMVKAK